MSLPTTATPRDVPAGRLPASLDWVQMLTGAALSLFIIVHLLSLSSVLFGPRVLTALDAFYERLGLTQLGLPAIGALLVVHFILAARKIPTHTGQQAVLLAHAGRMAHVDTWLWVAQAVTGMIMLVLGLAHLWTVLTDLPVTAVKSAARIQGGWWLAFYGLLLPATAVHIAVGLARIGVKWGLVGRAGRPRLQKAQYAFMLVCCALGGLILLRFFLVSPN